MSSSDWLVVAGEASGDLHGARLLSALQTLLPGFHAFGLGGEEMRAAGFEAVADSAEISVVGITEVGKILRRAREIFRLLLTEVERRGVRQAVLIDFAEFNLRLAKALHARGVRVVYYISPQVWAWRRGRVKSIAKTVDLMLVLFPFEVDFYRQHGVDVVHVGHPLLDEVPQLVQAWDEQPPAEAPATYVLSLLPGSRSSEVAAILPAMLASARELARQLPLRVQLIQAPTVPPELVERLLAAGGDGLPIVQVHHDRFQAIAASHLALCASGTATLEVGLLGTPLCVLYRLSRFSYLLARLLVKLPHFSLVNLVLGENVVPELLQAQMEPRRVAAQARQLLTDRPAIDAMRRRLGRLRQLLGPSGASRRAAEEIVARFGRGAAS